ncbi:MAG: hypothetical protein EOP91_09345 [Lysobacteraceae bacterium]|nr:MAG: hypothetical protein EOP91_09345 [Xanthomonadaceae bacterium]
MPDELFVLAPRMWRSWQMLPGYVGERMVPYCSPIYVHSVQPLKTGKGLLRLRFFNAFYASGVQDFDVRLEVLKRASTYLMASLDDCSSGRSAIIGHMEFDWLGAFCPQLLAAHPPERCSAAAQGSVSVYLDEVFGEGTSNQ